MVVNDGVGDNRAQNGLHGGQTFKGPVRHKGVPVKAQLVSNSTVPPVYVGSSRFIMLDRFVPVSPSYAPECFPACHACPWWRYGSIPVRHDSSWLTVDNPGQ